MISLQFVRREHWGADVWEYFFQPETPLKYLAGQYASFSIADVLDARGNTRTFTMTSLPSDKLISFAVKISSQPSPYKLRLSSFRPGDVLLMGEPMGDLVMPRTLVAPLLFVAGGLGIASYISLLRTKSSATESNPVSLVWAIRSQADQYNLPILETLTDTNRHIYVAPERLSVDDITGLTTAHTLIYLSGSEHFVSGLRSVLHARGITDSRILFDYFSGYNEL